MRLPTLLLLSAGFAAAEEARPLPSLLTPVQEAVSRRSAADVAQRLAPFRRALAEAKRQDPACFRPAEARAWELSRSAEGERWTEASEALGRLWSDLGRCGQGAPRAALAAGDVDWALERAARRQVAAARDARSALCSSKARRPLERLSADLAAGAYDKEEVDRLRDAVGPDVVRFAAMRSLSEARVEACERWEGVDRHLVSATEAAARCGTMPCRQKFSVDALTKAFALPGPESESACRANLAVYKPELAAKAQRVCSLISANVGDAGRLCGLLIEDGVLERSKLESCVSEFSRFAQRDGPEACKPLESWPSGWEQRCYDVAAYRKARAAKDASLCGDREMCWVFMGAWTKRYGEQEERRLAQRACKALDELARERGDEADVLARKVASLEP